MTMRGFLACYVVAVMFVGAAGASAYHELLHRPEAMDPAALTSVAPVISIPAAEATALAPAIVASTSLAPVAAAAKPRLATTQLPKLRPHIVAQAKPLPRLPSQLTTAHSPSWPPPPSPQPVVRYGYSAYGGYYQYYYPPYRYYRSF
jgi:hypothetical protein